MPDMLVITFMKLVHIVLKHNVKIQEKTLQNLIQIVDKYKLFF